MRIPFWIKLALSMILIMSITLAAGGYMGHRSFEQGFLEYINDIQGERLEYLVEQLQNDYSKNQNWDFLKKNENSWLTYLHQNLAPDFRRGNKPRPYQGNDEIMPRREVDARLLSTSLSLVTAEQTLISGLPAQNDKRKLLTPLYYDNNLIGYLRFQPFAKLTESLDRSFAEQRKKSFLLIGLLSLIFTALASWLISRHFRGIVRTIINSAKKMANGDYTQRIDIDRNDEIGQLAHSFNVLSNSLEKNQQARQQWIADISHELRTPLAVLRGELEALEDGVREVTPSAITSLTSEVNQLNKLVDDLYELSLSDLGALNYQMQETDPRQVFSSAFDSFNARFEKAGLDCNFKSDEKTAIVLADESRLTQLFSNLLENSLRYTNAGGQVNASCIVVDKSWQMTLVDSSPAVTPEQLPNLFERFYRTDTSRGRNTGGAGLGLAIVSEIVKAHNGSIEASLSELGGIQIELRIPLSEI